MDNIEHRPDTKTPPDEESVFSRLMNTPVGRRLPDGRVAAVVVFAPGVTTDEANAALRSIGIVEDINVNEFNPEYGWPVFYVP